MIFLNTSWISSKSTPSGIWVVYKAWFSFSVEKLQVLSQKINKNYIFCLFPELILPKPTILAFFLLYYGFFLVFIFHFF